MSYDRQTATPKKTWPSVPPSVPVVAEPKKAALRTVADRLTTAKKKKAAKAKALAKKNNAQTYGPTEGDDPPIAEAKTTASILQATACPADCKCAAHSSLASSKARGNGARQRPGGVIAALTERTYDTPRTGVESFPPPPHTPLHEAEPALPAARDQPSGIVISNDEIDNEKTDTFGPFRLDDQASQDPPPPDDAFLSQITFDGEDQFQQDCKKLC